MPRIWFNRTYSTTSHVIAMLRDNPAGRRIQVIATHSDLDSPVLLAADEAYPEPDLGGADYVDWALDFARAHRVDVLFPRLAMADLAGARDRFAGQGTAIAAPEAGTVRLFEDKAATYRAASALGLPVPPYRVVHDPAGLRQAYAELADLGPVCMKPVRGTGGAGFRILSTDPPDLSEFSGKSHPKAELGRVAAALAAALELGRTPTPLLLAPLLSGPELSIDALADRDGTTLAAIGRGRSRRRRLLVDDAPARRVAELLNRAHRIAYLSNTQVRYWQGPGDTEPLPYLLELNTRISGGLFQTVLSGVNLPWAALQLALGEPVAPLRPVYGGAFTTVAALVALDRRSDAAETSELARTLGH